MARSQEDSNHHPWKKNAWTERQELRDALKAIPEGYAPNKSVAVDDMHAYAQKCLFEYYSIFEPKKEDFGGDLDPREADAEELQDSLWWEPLMTTKLPVDGDVRLNGSSQMLKEDAGEDQLLATFFDKIPREKYTLRLGNLPALFQSNNTFTVEFRGWVSNQGQVDQDVTETRYLPLSAILTARRQLDACLEEGGWLPEIASTPRTKITEEMLEEVEEWRQQNINQ